MTAPQHDWLWWFGPWRSLIPCTCGALTYPDRQCPVCGRTWSFESSDFMDSSGHLRRIPASLAGAVDWSDYVLLKLMHVEWQRAPGHSDTISGLPTDKRPSQRLILVILFWTLFERLMQRFFETATREIPEAVAQDLLRRYSMIGARLDRLYPLLFQTSFASDLADVGFPTTHSHLADIQRARNAFIHGEPEAITDTIVEATVERLREVQEAWIALYNKRCVRLP